MIVLNFSNVSLLDSKYAATFSNGICSKSIVKASKFYNLRGLSIKELLHGQM